MLDPELVFVQLRVPRALHERLKIAAIKSHTTLAALILDALRGIPGGAK